MPALSKSALHSYGGGYFSPSRNILFINKQTRKMHWLYQDNRQLITDIDLLSSQEECANKKIDAILYKIIKNDTNNDGQLNSDDITDIGISYPDGSDYKEIFQTVESVFGAINLDGKKFLFIYQSKGNGYASTILLSDMSVQWTDELPRVKKP